MAFGRGHCGSIPVKLSFRTHVNERAFTWGPVTEHAKERGTCARVVRRICSAALKGPAHVRAVGLLFDLRLGLSSPCLTFEIFSFHEDFHRFSFSPRQFVSNSLCSRLFSGFDFVFAFDFVFPFFSSPCLRVSVVNIGFWLWPATLCPLWLRSYPACKTHAMAAATRSHCSVSLSSWRLPALVSL